MDLEKKKKEIHAIKWSYKPLNAQYKNTDLKNNKWKTPPNLHKAYFLLNTLLNLDQSRDSYLRCIYPKSQTNAKAAIDWRTSIALIPQKPGNRLSSLAEACGSYTPGPAHHPSHQPLGKGRGWPPQGLKAAREAAVDFLTCLEFMVC